MATPIDWMLDSLPEGTSAKYVSRLGENILSNLGLIKKLRDKKVSELSVIPEGTTAKFAENAVKLGYDDLTKLKSLLASVAGKTVGAMKGTDELVIPKQRVLPKKVQDILDSIPETNPVLSTGVGIGNIIRSQLKTGPVATMGHKDKPLDFSKTIFNKIPGEFDIADVVRSLKGFTGSATPSVDQAAKFKEWYDKWIKNTGVEAALPPIVKPVLGGGVRQIPTQFSIPTQVNSPGNGSTPEGYLDKFMNALPRNNPVLQQGANLANLFKTTQPRTNVPFSFLNPGASVTKKASLMDILKPIVEFGVDIATDPLTAVGGVGGAGVKAIKAAAGPGAQIGKQVFDAFGELAPRIIAGANDLAGGKDPMKLYNALRSPSKILSPALQEATTKYIRDIGMFTDKAQKRVRKWANETPESRKAIGEALYNNDYSKLDQKQGEIALGFRRIIDQAKNQAVKGGVLKPENIIAAGQDSYVRRMYQYFENHANWIKNNPDKSLTEISDLPMGGGGNKINTKIFSGREADLATRARLGELGPEQIGFSAGEGSRRTFVSGRKGEMFQDLGAAKGFVNESLPAEMLANPKSISVKKVKTSEGSFDSLNMVEHKGQQWAQIPDNKGYGQLAGKWVARPDAEAIVGTHAYKGSAMKLYEKSLGLWKAGKVLLSVPAQARNMMTNTLLMVYSGIPFGSAVRKMSDQTRRSLNGEPLDVVDRAFIKFGGMGKTWADTDALKAGSSFVGVNPPNRLVQGLKDASKIPGKIYSGIENNSKKAIMRYWHEEKGLSLKESFDKAMDILFDYGDTSKFINAVRKSPLGIPFVTFASKALPFTAKSVLSRPGSVLPLIAAKDVFNNHQIDKLGLNDQDVSKIKDRFGEWALIVGGTKQNPDIMDMSYIVPGLADMSGNSGSRGLLGANSPIPQSFQPSSPLLSLSEVIPGINKRFYFQQPVWKDTDLGPTQIPPVVDNMWKDKAKKLGRSLTNKEKSEILFAVLGQSKPGKAAKSVYANIAPANALIPGTYQRQQIESAISGLPATTTGEVQKPITVALGQIGIKVTPFDIKKAISIASRMPIKNIKNLNMGNLPIAKSKLSNEQKEILRNIIKNQINIQRENLRKQIGGGK